MIENSAMKRSNEQREVCEFELDVEKAMRQHYEASKAVEVQIEKVLASEAVDSKNNQKAEQVKLLVAQRAQNWRLHGLLKRSCYLVKKHRNKAEAVRNAHRAFKKQIKNKVKQNKPIEINSDDEIVLGSEGEVSEAD